MADKKLTDNEIIKALDNCDEGDCSLCPYDGKGCFVVLMPQARGLILRQQAEIERLHKEAEYWEAEAKEARADIDQAVNEAIKEFAEELKGVYNTPRYDRQNAHTLIGKLFENIDNLVKRKEGAGDA